MAATWEVALSKESQFALALHNLPEVAVDILKTLMENFKFARLTRVEGHALRVLAQAHQPEAKIGLVTLSGRDKAQGQGTGIVKLGFP